jgi:hypothetical protein
MTHDETPAPETAPAASRRQAAAWLAGALALPLLLAACKTGSTIEPTRRPERWPPGGR